MPASILKAPFKHEPSIFKILINTNVLLRRLWIMKLSEIYFCFYSHFLFNEIIAFGCHLNGINLAVLWLTKSGHQNTVRAKGQH